MTAIAYSLAVYLMQSNYKVVKIIIDMPVPTDTVENILAYIKEKEPTQWQENLMVCRYAQPVKLQDHIHHTEQLELVLPLQISANEKRRKKLLRKKNR